VPLPIDDSFDGGSPVYDTSTLSGSYVRFLGWTSDPAYASGGSGYVTTPWTKLGKGFSGHSPGYMSTSGTEYIRPLVMTTENLVGVDQGTAFPTGFALRDYSVADCRVSMAFKTKTNFPSTSGGTFYIGVAARLSGGTLTDAGTSTAHLLGGDGYYFAVMARTASGVKYQILRVNAGTVTRLGETPTGDPASAGNGTAYATWLESNSTKTLRLNVFTNGSQVELRGYVKVGNGADTLVLSVNDTSGSRITTAGRCGFFSSNEHVVTGNIARCLPISYFRVRTYAGAIIANDDFRRVCDAAAASVTRTFTGLTFPTFGTTFGANGRDLTSGWFGDLRSVSTFQARLSRSSDRLLLDSSSTDKTGYYFSQRFADDPRGQDRQIEFEFATGGPGVAGLTRGAGVVLRGTVTSAGSTPLSGYLLEAQLVEDTLTSQVFLYRIRNSVATVIARKVTGLTFTRGTTYDLRLRVDTLANPDPINGTARLRAYIDGVLVQLVAASTPAPGVTIFSDGVVYDGSSDRITTGWAEGFYVRSLATATAHIYIDSWAVGVGGDDPTTEETHATIPIDDEDDTASGTFSIPYDWSSSQEDRLGVIDHPLELDYRYIGKAQSATKRTLRFGCKAATDSELATLTTFWEDHKGREIPFTFTWPDGTTGYARFTMDALKSRKLAPDVHEWEASVEEVRSGS